MATTTTHYGFTKPGVNDYVDITVLNTNFDNLDTVIYNNQLSAQAALDDIAPEYDATATYSVGDYVTYNETLYRCTTAITTAEAFDGTKWTTVKVGGELKSHDARISDLEAGVELEGEATNSFDDGIDSYFKKVVSTIVPVQAGSGTPSPTNERPITGFTECAVKDFGDNIFDIDATHTTPITNIYQYDFTVEPNTAYICISDIPQSTPASIYFNGSSSSDNGVYIDNPRIVTSGADGKLYVLVRYSDVGGGYDAYTAIKNGTYTLTLAKVSTATIQFGSAGTVYGGYVDLISGKLVVTHGFKQYDGSENWINVGGNFPQAFQLDDTSLRALQDDRKYLATKNISNLYPWIATDDSSYGIRFQVASFPSGRLFVYDNNYSGNLSGFLSHLQNTPLQICYLLATPQEYQLTPAQLRSLVGTNNLTSSTGEVTEVEYIKNKTIAWLLDLIRA